MVSACSCSSPFTSTELHEGYNPAFSTTKLDAPIFNRISDHEDRKDSPKPPMVLLNLFFFFVKTLQKVLNQGRVVCVYKISIPDNCRGWGFCISYLAYRV